MGGINNSFMEERFNKNFFSYNKKFGEDNDNISRPLLFKITDKEVKWLQSYKKVLEFRLEEINNILKFFTD